MKIDITRNVFKVIDLSAKPVKQVVASGWSILRSAIFLAEAQPLRLIDAWVRKDFSAFKIPPGYQATVIKELRALIEKDIENFLNGVYPMTILAYDLPLFNGRKYLRLLRDSAKIIGRKKNQKNKEFSKDANKYLIGTPEYYQRNFHFQTDGYLSSESAELYEHQVEILFRGTVGPMRRLIISPLLDYLKKSKFNLKGRGLKILDIACGPGSSSRLLAETFSEAQITCLDLSTPYIEYAQKSLSQFERVDFVQGDAAKMLFGAHSFDIVCSTFLFHELPLEVRRQILKESQRVLKPGGFWAMVDSIQKDDVPGFNWALERFPVDFHEPFYRNYSLNSMEQLATKSGLKNIKSNIGFFSKVVWGQAPSATN
jgi:ubiquinone/menaquinone biosynthesis C-methylase UbiE